MAIGKGGRNYRLPTEAEWEYACRATTSTAYNTGETLPSEYHKQQVSKFQPEAVSLKVGKTPPNQWGLYDMHGNVEEWCLDWYGAYPQYDRTDPVGYSDGDFKVTRGGSHNTKVRYLRSANRLGAVAGDKSWLIGFRVVQAPVLQTNPIEDRTKPLWATNVNRIDHDWSGNYSDMTEPFFEGLKRFYKYTDDDTKGPLYRSHNHCPDITGCPNGDILVSWYSTISEFSYELAAAASRLRKGSDSFDKPSLFYKAPDRNMHTTSLHWDNKNTLYHFNGIAANYGIANLALIVRKSIDSGATWSKPKWINSERGVRNMPEAGVFHTEDGWIVVPCDASSMPSGGTGIYIGDNTGNQWYDPGISTIPLRTKYRPGVTGGSIAGIHAAVVELKNGNLMGIGRGDYINNKSPMSISSDFGKTWTYSQSPFPPISWSQRVALLRLNEGPILFLSFTGKKDGKTGMIFKDEFNNSFNGYGMFAAVSFDEGKTWPVKKLITDGQKHTFDYEDEWTNGLKIDATHAEPKGYLAVTQTPDNFIHLVSSAFYYKFNLAWLKKPNVAGEINLDQN